ncbi:hypothetical protein BH10PSE12_BH10PSE12_01720 [soil metagenome]
MVADGWRNTGETDTLRDGAVRWASRPKAMMCAPSAANLCVRASPSPRAGACHDNYLAFKPSHTVSLLPVRGKSYDVYKVLFAPSIKKVWRNSPRNSGILVD